MNPVRVTYDLVHFPPGTKEVVIAKDQPEYQPLPTYRIPGPEGRVITCWMPSEEELMALRAGEPVVIEVLTFNHPFQPMIVMVGQREGEGGL